ncbi:MAG: methyltransferase family protein [Candidatus Hermodarchaeia archaeon]|jgi:protein-S-isoprenylcysteine O-methyltransferase Ste14
MSFLKKIKTGLLNASGYLVLLLQQIPPLGVYPALMTLPVFLYLLVLAAQFPWSIPNAIIEGIQMSILMYPLEAIIAIAGLVLVIYSLVYLHNHRKEGLVTTGPYRFIRHPQYAGFILLTLGLTAMSYNLLRNTFGMGWLTPEATLGLWFGQLAIYFTLALIEESHLSKTFGATYVTYKENTSFLLPLKRLGYFEMPLSITFLVGILFILIILGAPPIFAV